MNTKATKTNGLGACVKNPERVCEGKCKYCPVAELNLGKNTRTND